MLSIVNHADSNYLTVNTPISDPYYSTSRNDLELRTTTPALRVAVRERARPRSFPTIDRDFAVRSGIRLACRVRDRILAGDCPL